jgi:glycosyltransferase involved in cell wall biosynthesis
MPTPLGVCLVSQEFPPYTNWGGVGIQFDTLARALAQRGHRVVVVSRAARGAPAHERLASGVEVWRVGVPITRKRLTGRTLDRMLHARAVFAKVAELDASRPFDVVEGPSTSLDAERLLQDSRFADRVVISVHGSNFKGQVGTGVLAPLHRLDWHWSGRRELECLRRAPTVAVPSQATRDLVLGYGVDAAKIDLVPLGIDTTAFMPPAARPPGPLIVGFVGRLSWLKGIDFVWRVMDALGPDAGVRFHFKGAIYPGDRDEVLSRLARYAAFAEHQPAGSHTEMPEFYRSTDVLLGPSRFENFGLTYAEGMATELLVFAGVGGSCKETVTDGVTGFLVDPEGPVDGVVDRLRTLAADRSAFAGIRRRAREEAVRRMSIESFATGKETEYLAVRARGSRTGKT